MELRLMIDGDVPFSTVGPLEHPYIFPLTYLSVSTITNYEYIPAHEHYYIDLYDKYENC